MSAAYLDSLPELHVNIDLSLAEGEKVVFEAPLSCFGTETDQLLGGAGSRLYLTNRSVIAKNPVGLWTVDLADDVASCELERRGVTFFSSAVVCVGLNGALSYGAEQETLSGFRFYLKKKAAARLMELMDAALA
ncbi:hypothetical protein ACULPM_02440 [Thermophilibacter sp. ZX-H3]|uniref:hypothetical protein n=1 Tax=unclassified Thermophilibacter TaxID=2847308 RepID=UPI0040407A25